MGKNILLIQGHPDSSQRHWCHALEDAYLKGASAAGHEIRRIDVAKLDFPLLRSQLEWELDALPPALVPAQDAIKWAEHLVLFFPLWLGDMPALLKGFLEQVARPGFAFSRGGESAGGKGPDGPVGARGCDHGNAGDNLSLVFSRAQHQVARTQYSRLCGHCAGARNPGRHGREYGAGACQKVAVQAGETG